MTPAPVTVKFAVAAALAICLTACAARPQSSRLTNADFDAATAAVALSLRNSDWLAARNSESPPIVVVIDRVENRMDEVLSMAEQWMYVAKVANSLPVTTMERQKNLRFIIPPERHAMLRTAGFDGDFGPGLTPTHLLSATFMSSARGGRGGGDAMTNLRSDLYYMNYTITELPGRAIVWQDQFEFQRQAAGRLID